MKHYSKNKNGKITVPKNVRVIAVDPVNKKDWQV